MLKCNINTQNINELGEIIRNIICILLRVGFPLSEYIKMESHRNTKKGRFDALFI